MTINDTSLLGRNKIAIIGDLLIDRTQYVQTSRISPEAPVLVLDKIKEDITTPGGAGLSAAYATKNSFPHLFLPVCNFESEQILNKKDINFKVLGTLENISKVRYIDKESGYQICRIDDDLIFLENQKFNYELILNNLKNILDKDKTIKVALLLDYKKGLFNEDFSIELISLLKFYNIKIYCDSKGDVNNFKNINILKLNNKELQTALTRLNLKDSYELISYLNLHQLIITKGKDGASLFQKGEEFSWKTKKEGLANVVGCGDVFDTNFCYFYYLERYKAKEALMASVYAATKFAHENIETRL